MGALVCVYAKGMQEPWCLAARDPETTVAVLVNHYAKRWTIEPSFRDNRQRRSPGGKDSGAVQGLALRHGTVVHPHRRAHTARPAAAGQRVRHGAADVASAPPPHGPAPAARRDSCASAGRRNVRASRSRYTVTYDVSSPKLGTSAGRLFETNGRSAASKGLRNVANASRPANRNVFTAILPFSVTRRRERQAQRFKSARHAQRFLSAHTVPGYKLRGTASKRRKRRQQRPQRRVAQCIHSVKRAFAQGQQPQHQHD